MTISIRPARLSDLDALCGLLLADARERQAKDSALWRLADDPREKIRAVVKAAMENENPPFRQQWLIAQAGGAIVGVAHSILLPVPPIYAGESGPPGLIMEDCFVAPGAPGETRAALLDAAEADLVKAGARILLASSQVGGAWETAYAARGYEPLTLYFARTGLSPENTPTDVRKATADDVPAIVASSAVNRQVLFALHRFWKPHADAYSRFGAWMTRSLTLSDRDMFVPGAGDTPKSYAISQPATPLHFPAPHDISRIGVIDDFYHDAFADPERLSADASDAAALFAAAEAARARRGNDAVLVVCPAAWQSKIDLLKSAGYSNAITWFIRMPEQQTA
ncbi:hypothetical protein [Pararhodobacter sp.]|uniref:hypothetical protein n=1 Tax=Pararhodobacter sp. TaxID=2127056 RepID=UPI002FDCCDD8